VFGYANKGVGMMNIHEFDQLVASFRDLAKIQYEHYTKLIEAGFTEEQAMQLATEFQTEVLNKTK